VASASEERAQQTHGALRPLPDAIQNNGGLFALPPRWQTAGSRLSLFCSPPPRASTKRGCISRCEHPCANSATRLCEGTWPSRHARVGCGHPDHHLSVSDFLTRCQPASASALAPWTRAGRPTYAVLRAASKPRGPERLNLELKPNEALGSCY
jgi:hypothetical protein